MSRSIILWRNHREQSTDDAGTSITSSVLAPPIYFTPGPYEESDSATTQGGALRYVPSLSYFCIKILTESPEQVHPFGAPRLVYQPPASPEDYDILRALIPSYYPSLNGNFGINGFKIGQVDPRLWAVLIQLFVGLPDVFSTYLIALSDKHLPLLQHIPATTHFSLLTVVDLHGSPHLTDDTILELRALHGLVALDASETTLTAQGIRRLSGTLLWTDDGEIDSRRRRGPWQLRILRLRNCRKVGNLVLEHLEAFPLLTVVDLRGTQCRPTNRRFPKSFRPATDRSLFHPTALLQSLCSLSSSHTIFSSDNPYVLYVDRLHYSRPTSRYSVKSSVVGENTFVATMPTLPHSIPSSISSAKQFVSGSSDVLLRQETRERQQRLDDAYEAVRDNDGNDSNDDDNNDDHDHDHDSPVHRAMLIRDRLEILDRAKSLLASIIQENVRI
ncbi:hypothetical protein BV25DRAFT_1671610 [Artomyces pyxidatus]|uniref:Uncharacterized protein n=1 Tax=Artomyces pyxidatus TaxID=48021 RepID=A0ACB8T9Y9_9AGAM|nr:hypothetical protein BV25DRAFT_1671610 [Artomyces pyxidatus]